MCPNRILRNRTRNLQAKGKGRVSEKNVRESGEKTTKEDEGRAVEAREY